MIRKPVRPSHGTAVAYLALFVALSGTSYAAVTLSRDDVRSRHIGDGQVKKRDIRKNAVNSRKVKDDALRSRDIRNGTLLSEDFKPGQLVAGAPGPAGPAGPQGPKGDPGLKGEKGDLGPTEGTATDHYTVHEIPLTPTKTFDKTKVTTTRAGRLLVSKTVGFFEFTCSTGGTGNVYLLLDGVPVPGTVVNFLPEGVKHRAVTLTGVTTAVIAAGDHTVEFGADCGNPDSMIINSHVATMNAAVVVLGS